MNKEILIYCLSKHNELNAKIEFEVLEILHVIEEFDHYNVIFTCRHIESDKISKYSYNIRYDVYKKNKFEIRNKKLNRL